MTLVKADIWPPMNGPVSATTSMMATIFGTKVKRDFLDLRQRLDQGDADADRHGDQHHRSGRGQHRPYRVLDDVEGVGLVHAEAFCRNR